MADQLTLVDVERVAALAHIELSDHEKHRFLEQLNEILVYAEQIRTIDTTGVPPTAHVLGQQPTDRPDMPRPSLARDEALAAAPEASRDAGLFRVPRVIGAIE